MRAALLHACHATLFAVDALPAACPSPAPPTRVGAFDRFDLDCDGHLSSEECDLALQSVGVHFTPGQLAAFLRLGHVMHEEHEHEARLSEAEFLAMVRRARRGATAVQTEGVAAPTTRQAAKRAAPAPAPAPVERVSSAAPAKPTPAVAPKPAGVAPKHAPAKAAPPKHAPPRYAPPKASVPPRAAVPARGAKGPRTAEAPTPSRRASDASLDLEGHLAGVIGLEPIKDKVRALKDTLVKRRFRREVGAPLVELGPLHMLFRGNPGCGKTSSARRVVERRNSSYTLALARNLCYV